MKVERVVTWIEEGDDSRAAAVAGSAGFPFPVEVVAEPSVDEVIHRLERDPRNVLLIEDSLPFQRTRRFLKRTEDRQSRPVVIVLARIVDVQSSVSLMENGVFTVIPGEYTAAEVVAAVSRALANRRAFEKIMNMSASLRDSKGTIVKKTLELNAEKVKLHKKVSEVSIMRRVAEWLGKARTMEEGLNEMIVPLCRFVGADSGAFLISPGENRWVEVDTGLPGSRTVLLPRDPARFRNAVRLRLLPETMGFAPDEGEESPGWKAVAFPVRIKRRYLGYGLLWGSGFVPPAPATLRLLEAVGVQMGIYCENLTLNAQVSNDRDRLEKVNEELNFLLRLSSTLHEYPDMEAVFKGLCGELRGFIPYLGLELVSLTGVPTLRTCGFTGVGGLPGGKGRTAQSCALTHHLLDRHGIPTGGLDLLHKEVRLPEGMQSPPIRTRGENSSRRWEALLSFGPIRLGVLAVNLPCAPGEDEERLLRSVAAQLSLFLHNILEREKVREMATHDGLTGLYNFRSFREIFGREFERFLRYGRNLTMVMIDLDDFKGINDTLGHQEGDKVLQSVAGIVQRNLRKTDYGFRYGGDEFVVLLPDQDAVQSEMFARRILAAVRKQFRGVSPYPSSFSLSIGIADCGSIASLDGEELVGRTDGALYRAKKSGKDRIEIAAPATPHAAVNGGCDARV